MGSFDICTVYHYSDCTADTRWACAHFWLHTKIFPWLLSLSILHAAAGAHDQVLYLAVTVAMSCCKAPTLVVVANAV